MIFSSLFICPCVYRTVVSSSEENKKEMDSKSHVGIELQQDNKIPKKSCKFGKVVLGITGATALGIVLVTAPFITPALRKICLPYVPATERQVTNIIKMAKTSKRKGSTMVDLGSGDGRVASFTLCVVFRSVCRKGNRAFACPSHVNLSIIKKNGRKLSVFLNF